VTILMTPVLSAKVALVVVNQPFTRENSVATEISGPKMPNLIEM
jgi:hypothetical protein